MIEDKDECIWYFVLYFDSNKLSRLGRSGWRASEPGNDRDGARLLYHELSDATDVTKMLLLSWSFLDGVRVLHAQYDRLAETPGPVAEREFEGAAMPVVRNAVEACVRAQLAYRGGV